jgi:hypothetical protein
MSLPFAIVLSTAIVCVTVLAVVAVSFVWVSRQPRTCPHCGQPLRAA